jgi:hypothetical protein
VAKYNLYQRLAACLIPGIEAPLERTVQIEYANKDLIASQGHHKLRSGGYVASNMAEKGMDVRHKYRLAANRRDAAHAAAKRNSTTGRLSLERSQNQIRATGKVKACPVHRWQSVVDCRRDVGQVSDSTDFARK